MSKGEKTKLNIIDIATNLFYSKGFDDVTFAQIAEKAHLTQPALYQYFRNKLYLLAACAQVAAEQGREYILSKMNPMAPPDEQLHTYLAANVDWFGEKRPQALTLLSIYHFASAYPLMNQLRQTIEETGINRIAIMIQQAQHAGLFKVEDLRATAQLVHSLMVGEMFKMFYEPDAMDKGKRIARMNEAVFAILNQRPSAAKDR